MSCTVDANVFVAAACADETHHPDSYRFLRQVEEHTVGVICPTLVLPECAAAVARAADSAKDGIELIELLQALPHVHLVPIELRLARRAAEIAAAHR